MHECLYGLAIVSSAKTGTYERQDRSNKRGSALLDVRNVVRLILLTEKVDSHHDTVLAIRKSLDAMVARRAQRLSASVALDVRDVLTVVGTIHLLLIVNVGCSVDRLLILRSIGRFAIPRGRALLISLFG